MLGGIYLKCIEMKNRVSSYIREDRGDTNFISILILLIIVCVLAGVFVGFKDDIIMYATKSWKKTLKGLN